MTYEKDCRAGLRELDDICIDCGELLPNLSIDCKDCPIKKLKDN
jgi:hypothetical protein